MTLLAAFCWTLVVEAAGFEIPDEAVPVSGDEVHGLLEKLKVEVSPDDGEIIEEVTGRAPARMTPQPIIFGRTPRYKREQIDRMSLDELEKLVNAEERRPLGILIVVDGLGGRYFERYLFDPEFRRAYSPADLPSIRENFYQKGRVVDLSLSSTPTISARNLAILASGLAAGDPGNGNGHSVIPNFSFIDRERGEWFNFWGTDGLALDDIFQRGGKTVFQRLLGRETFSFTSLFHKGATTYYSVIVGEILRKIRRGYHERRALAKLRSRANKEIELSGQRQQIVQMIGELRKDPARKADSEESLRRLAFRTLNAGPDGLPDLVYWYNSWIDHQSHDTGAYSPQVLRGVLPELEEYVSGLLKIYQDPKLPAAARENLLVTLVSDHGHVVAARDFSVEEVFAKNKIDFDKITVDEGRWPTWRIRAKRSVVGREAVFGSTAGGNFVIDLFHTEAYAPLAEGRYDKKNLLDKERWKKHPTYSDCKTYRLFDGRTVDLIALLKEQLLGLTPDGQVENVLDYIVLRDDGYRREAPVLRVVSPTGESRVERRREANGTFSYRYSVLSGVDPVGYAGTPGHLGELVESGAFWPDSEWLEATRTTLRPDVVHELAHLYDLETAGTINLFPKEGWSVASLLPGRHAGETLGEKNSIQLYAGPVVKGTARIPVARGGSAPVTLMHHLMGASFDPKSFDFPSLLPVLSEQGANPTTD